MLINEKIVRQIIRKNLLKEVNKKIQNIKLLNEETKFKQDPAYEKGTSKFILVPGPRDKKKEFVKLSKTIRDHLSGKMGVTGNPNYKTAISNLSTDAKVDKIISDIAVGKDAGLKAGLFKKYGEYIKGQSGEIPTNLKVYVEEYVNQIETKIENGEKNKDNIIKVSEQVAITVMDKQAAKRSSQPRTKKKKEKEDFLSDDPKGTEKEKEDPKEKDAEKTDKKGSGQAAAKSDEKVYRLKGELSQSEPDKFWGYYTLINGNWNYIQKKKGGWKPEDGRDKGKWKPVKGQKAVNKLNGGTLIDVSTNKPETKSIKGKADPAAKKKRRTGRTNTTRPKLKDVVKYWQKRDDQYETYKITYSSKKTTTGSVNKPKSIEVYKKDDESYASPENQKEFLKTTIDKLKKNLDGWKQFEDDPHGEYNVDTNILPPRKKGESWKQFYLRKDVQQGLVKEFQNKYKIKKNIVPYITGQGSEAYGWILYPAVDYTPYGDAIMNKADVSMAGPYPGVIRLMMGKFEDSDLQIPGELTIRFNGAVGSGTGKKGWAEAIEKVGGDAEAFEDDYKAADSR